MNQKIKRFIATACMILSCTACKFTSSDNSLNQLQYDQTQLNFTKDGNGNSIIQGTGSLLSKKTLSTETGVVQIRVKAVFFDPASILTVYSHSKSDNTQSYEFRIARLGNSLRVTTALNSANPLALGIIYSNVTDWTVPLEFVLQIDNSEATPVAKIWPVSSGPFDSSSTPALTETRTEGYPSGNRVGASLSNISLYSFNVEEIN